MSSVKENLNSKLKSSPRFGDLFVQKNWQELLKERRFLFFTKRGPIEIVFNIKHYISGLLLTLLVAFKLLQFIFFGAFHIFTSVVLHNNLTQTQQFTESEVEALKDLAESVIDSNQDEKTSSIIIETENDNKVNFGEKFKNQVSNIVSYFRRIEFSILKLNDIEMSDESVFDKYSGLANPHMVPIEETLKNVQVKKTIKPQSQVNIIERHLYNSLPVLPFAAPRNNKTKMIQFSKTIDLEILELVNVFKTLNLTPDNIDLTTLDKLSENNLFESRDSELIDEISFRFNYLDKLKEAMIFLPLKPPMQYYYVSSPFGMRIHPKSKKKQMHKGIDMAGTWQEEVRASANGKILFSGRFGSFGKVIKIKHKHGVETLYGHLHKLMVKKGDYVEEGQIIGKMGATGRAAGAHLHYEIKVDTKSVNPYNFISIGRNLVSSSIIK